VAAYLVEFAPGGKQMLQHCLAHGQDIEDWNQWVSKSEQRNFFVWLATAWEQNVLVHGTGPVDGVPTVLSSTRAEVFGIAAPYEFLVHFMKFHKIESMSKCVKCVVKWAAISRVNRTQHKHAQHHCYSNDVDIVTLIVACIKASMLQHQLWWAKAHQDDKKPYKELNLWGQ
jgi:hypothetical protein